MPDKNSSPEHDGSIVWENDDLISVFLKIGSMKGNDKFMYNDIKTFVYRTGQQVRKELEPRKRKIRKNLIYSLAVMVVLIASITSFIVIRSDRRTQAGVPSEENFTPGELRTAAESAVTEVSQPAKGKEDTKTIPSRTVEAALQKEIILYGLEADDDGIMLLGLKDDETEDTFIPAGYPALPEKVADSGSDGEDNGPDDKENGSETDSSTEKSADSTSDIEDSPSDAGDRAGKAEKKNTSAPSDVPEKLTYVYNEDMILDLDSENLTALYTIVEAEAGDQDIYGRMLVANVVINRVHSKDFADTVRGVIFEKIGGSIQFAPVRSGGRYYTVTVSDKTREAVDRVLTGEDYSKGALYFFQRSATAAYKAAWFDRELDFLFKYGCHEFFTE